MGGRASKEDLEQSRLIGQRIRRIRKRLGLPQESIAGRVGLSIQQVQKYETGKSLFGIGVLGRFARALAVTELQLFDGTTGAAPGVAEAAAAPFEFDMDGPDAQVVQALRTVPSGPEQDRLNEMIVWVAGLVRRAEGEMKTPRGGS